VSAPIVERSIDAMMADSSVSTWLKTALRDALERDPVDALNDALALAGILEDRLRTALDLTESP
jgi:hypothetical protein